MGCSASRLEDEEAVRLCRDRKNFIKEAIEQRKKFALGHILYIQSLRRVSVALRHYVDGGEQQHGDFMSDTCSTPPFTPIKGLSPEIGRIPFQYSSPLKSIQSEKCVSQTAHYMRSGGGEASISVEERPRSNETMRINSHYNHYHFNNPTDQAYGMDGMFGIQQTPPPPMTQSFFPPPSPYTTNSSPYHRMNYPPPSPSSSQWDFFWNPFSSLESYGYPGYSSLNRLTSMDDMAGLRKVREEEGIPDLEEEDDGEEEEEEGEQRGVVNLAPPRHVTSSVATTQVGEAGYNKPELNKNKVKNKSKDKNNGRTIEVDETKQCGEYQVKEFQSRPHESSNLMQTRGNAKIELADGKGMVGGCGRREVEEAGTPGFTAYMERRAMSLSEVMKDVEHQFMSICDAAHEVSSMLEASRASYSCNSAAIKMLNPVALFRSTSSRSSSSSLRILQGPPPSLILRDDSYETSSDISEESSTCMVSGSHQSTLDRLYAWEKKLYEEVKSGERVRKAYEKKCMQQIKNQDVTTENHSSLHKANRVERDLQTQIKVSIHSIEAISRRIQMLRDEELHPQIMELLQGLGRMWRTMVECHRIQKQVIDGAKLLLAKPKLADRPPPAARLARSAANLEAELRNWRSCLQVWIAAQRSYAHALTGWLLRCAPPVEESQTQRSSPLSPPRSSGEPLIFRVCIHWSRMMEDVSELQAVEGLDFFAAGVASVVAQQREAEEAKRRATARGEAAEMAEKEEGEEGSEKGVVVSPEKIAEVGVRVVCAGMSVAINGLAELAVKSLEGCEDLARRSQVQTPPSA